MQNEKAEPTEAEIEHNELQDLATSLGICCDTEFDKFRWFLVQCAQSQLPPGWTKELDPLNRVYYYNGREGKIQPTHPLLFKFRVFFHEFVE